MRGPPTEPSSLGALLGPSCITPVMTLFFPFPNTFSQYRFVHLVAGLPDKRALDPRPAPMICLPGPSSCRRVWCLDAVPPNSHRSIRDDLIILTCNHLPRSQPVSRMAPKKSYFKTVHTCPSFDDRRGGAKELTSRVPKRGTLTGQGGNLTKMKEKRSVRQKCPQEINNDRKQSRMCSESKNESRVSTG